LCDSIVIATMHWRERSALTAWATPFALLFGYAALLALPATRPFARELSLENRPIELLSFGLLLLAALLAIDLARRAAVRGESRRVSAFYSVFGVGLFVVGMEEVAWGQHFFGWSTPESWREINAQRETTLHNLHPLQGHQPQFRLAFALGGMLGILLGRFARFRAIAAPRSLLPWFTAIALASCLSHYSLVLDREVRFDRFLRVLSEMTELLIAIAAFLYITVNRRLLAGRWLGDARGASASPTP
jgi:hypothetical protein